MLNGVKLVLDLDPNLSRNLITSSLAQDLSLHIIFFKSVNNFLRRPMHRQTERQTAVITYTTNLVGVGDCNTVHNIVQMYSLIPHADHTHTGWLGGSVVERRYGIVGFNVPIDTL